MTPDTPAMDEKGLAERQRCEREWSAFQAWWKSSGHAADPFFTLTIENCAHAAWQAAALRLKASQEAEVVKDREDAERWRALMSSQRMRFMGCAGIDLLNKPGTTSRKTADLIPVMKPGEYQHFGMEFWSEHKAFGDPEYPDDFERALLVAYVDHLRAARALSHDEPADLGVGG